MFLDEQVEILVHGFHDDAKLPAQAVDEDVVDLQQVDVRRHALNEIDLSDFAVVGLPLEVALHHFDGDQPVGAGPSVWQRRRVTHGLHHGTDF